MHSSKLRWLPPVHRDLTPPLFLSELRSELLFSSTPSPSYCVFVLSHCVCFCILVCSILGLSLCSERVPLFSCLFLLFFFFGWFVFVFWVLGVNPSFSARGSGSWRQRKSSTSRLMRKQTRTLATCRSSDSTKLARYIHICSSSLFWVFDLFLRSCCSNFYPCQVLNFCLVFGILEIRVPLLLFVGLDFRLCGFYSNDLLLIFIWIIGVKLCMMNYYYLVYMFNYIYKYIFLRMASK